MFHVKLSLRLNFYFHMWIYYARLPSSLRAYSPQLCSPSLVSFPPQTGQLSILPHSAEMRGDGGSRHADYILPTVTTAIARSLRNFVNRIMTAMMACCRMYAPWQLPPGRRVPASGTRVKKQKGLVLQSDFPHVTRSNTKPVVWRRVSLRGPRRLILTAESIRR